MQEFLQKPELPYFIALRDACAVPTHVFGGLIVYTLANILLPGLALHAPIPAYGLPQGIEQQQPGESRGSEATPAEKTDLT